MAMSWTELKRRGKRPAVTLAAGMLILGAHWLGGWRAEAALQRDATTAAPAPAEPPWAQKPPDDAMKVSVPHSGAGARSSGVGGENWFSGNPVRLGDGFKRALAENFGEGSLGQAQRAMAGMGFSCAIGRGRRMACVKVLETGGCTLIWSVEFDTSGGGITGASGDGFSRFCG